MASRNDLLAIEYIQCDRRFDYKAKKALRVIIIGAEVAGLVSGIVMSCPTRIFEMGKATDPLQGLKKIGQSCHCPRPRVRNQRDRFRDPIGP